MLNQSLINLITLIILNCVGSGILILPVRLAKFGINSFYAWILTGLGALGIGIAFVRLGEEYSNKYKSVTEYSIQDLFAFQFKGFLYKYIKKAIFWTYWVMLIVGNLVLTITLLDSMAKFFPIITDHQILFQALVFFVLYLINRWGVQTSRFISALLVIIKLLLLVALPIICICLIKNTNPINLQYSTQYLLHAAFCTLWPLVGLETIVIERDIDLRMIKPAMIWGILICIMIYLLNTYAMMTGINNLSSSKSPYVELAVTAMGAWINNPINIGIILIMIGSLHGWTMATSSTCLSGADIVPPFFVKLNKYKVAERALAFSSIAPVFIVWLIQSIAKNSNALNIILDIATAQSLIVYLFACLVFTRIVIRNRSFSDAIFVICAYFYVILAIIGSPIKITIITTILTILFGFIGRNPRNAHKK